MALFHSGGAGYGGAVAVGAGGRIDRIESSNFDKNHANGGNGAGTLVVSTNESGSPQYTWNLSCSNPSATTPVFSSNPALGASLAFSGSDQTIRITNVGMAGTFLGVAQISFNPGYTVVSGLPITGLASGASADVIIRRTDLSAPPSTLVLQSNEPGSPTYSFVLAAAGSIPTLDPRGLMLLAAALAVLGVLARR